MIVEEIMWDTVKARKNCIVCGKPLFKGERYFRTYEKGKSVCMHCCKDAYEAMQENKEWVEKNQDYKIIETKADGGYGCK
jgi:predicted nucleic acid-binding Zn ribbon protein